MVNSTDAVNLSDEVKRTLSPSESHHELCDIFVNFLCFSVFSVFAVLIVILVTTSR